MLFGEGSKEAQAWLATQMHQLKHAGPASVLTEVRQLVATHADQANLGKELAYLEKREALMLEYAKRYIANYAEMSKIY